MVRSAAADAGGSGNNEDEAGTGAPVLAVSGLGVSVLGQDGERPVVEDGQIVIRPMNYLALSYDHRIIDGREAVLSLVAIKEALEDPARILLDL